MAKSFFDAADRLRRKTWTDLGEFANEVFAVFKTGRVASTTGATFTNEDDPSEPPVEVRQRADDQIPAISITRGGDTVTLSIGDNGGITFADSEGNPVPLNGVDGVSADDGSDGEDGEDGEDGAGEDGEDGDDGQSGEVRSSSTGLAGVVVSKVSGVIYSVKCYDSDPESNPPLGTANMVAANLDPEDTIPAGSEVVAVGFFNSAGSLTGGRIYPPVFLPRS